jgi:hypothetical protein
VEAAAQQRDIWTARVACIRLTGREVSRMPRSPRRVDHIRGYTDEGSESRTERSREEEGRRSHDASALTMT